MAGESSDLGVAGKIVCAGKEDPTRDPKKCPMDVTQKRGVSSDLGEKDFLWNVVGTEARFPVGWKASGR